MVHVIIIINPFDSARGRKDYYEPWEPNKPLSAYHSEQGEKLYAINGIRSGPESTVEDGQEIVVAPKIEGKAFKWILAVGAIVASAGFAAGIIGGMSVGWNMAIGLGLSLIGNHLMTNLTAPKVDLSNTDAEQSNTYGWGAPQTLTGQGYVLPTVFGKVKTAGLMLQRHVESNGEKQYLNILYCLAEGTLDDVTDIKLNGNPIENYSDVKTEIRNGSNLQSIIPDFNNSYSDTALAYELNVGKWNTVTLDGNAANGIEITISFPQGLYYSNDSGSADYTGVKLKAQYRKVGTEEWLQIPIRNENWDWHANESSSSRVFDNIFHSWDSQYYADCRKFMGYETYTDRWGRTHTKYDEDGEPIPIYTYTMSYSEWKDKMFKEHMYDGVIRRNTNSAFYRMYSIYDLDPAQYEVRVQCVSKDRKDIRTANKVQWVAVTQVIYDDFCYPGKALLGLKALATDQLSSSDPSMTCLVERSTVQVWNPDLQGYEDRPADNPAWAAYDILHHCRKVLKAKNITPIVFNRDGIAYTDDGGKVDSNTPRFQSDGLLLEGSTTNLWSTPSLTFKKDDEYAQLSFGASTEKYKNFDTVNIIVSGGDKFTNYESYRAGNPNTSGDFITISFVAKALVGNINDVCAHFFGGNTSLKSLTNLGDGWFKAEFIAKSNSNASINNSGVGFRGKGSFLISCIQYEKGIVASSYTLPQTTRQAENLYIENGLDRDNFKIDMDWRPVNFDIANTVSPKKLCTILETQSFKLYTVNFGGPSIELFFGGKYSTKKVKSLSENRTHRITVVCENAKKISVWFDGEKTNEVTLDGKFSVKGDIKFTSDDGNYFTSSVISNIRVSGGGLSDEEVLASQKKALVADSETIVMFPLTGDLSANMNAYIYTGIDRDNMDYYQFAAWADQCDKANIQFNYLYDTAMKIWDALNYPCRVGHGAIIIVGTKVSCIYDYASPPVQLFTVANIKKDSFSNEYLDTASRANCVEISFMNKDKNYERDVLSVYSEDYDSSDTVSQPTQIELMGCTDVEQAYRYGKYLLRQNKYQIRTVQFEAFADAIACEIGDVIVVQEDVTEWGIGGRIEKVDGNVVTLDQPVNDTYSYLLVRDNTTDHLTTYSIIGISNNTVTVANASEIQSGCVYALGDKGNEAKQFKVTSISNNMNEETRTITAIEYYPEVYDIDTDKIPEIVRRDSAVDSPKNLTLSTEKYTEFDGTVTNLVHCTWINPRQTYPICLEISQDGINWLFESKFVSGENTYTFTALSLKTYYVRIYSVNELGVKSDYIMASIVTDGTDHLPPDVSAINVEKMASGLRRYWWTFTYPYPNDIAGFRIKYIQGKELNWDNGIPVQDGLVTNQPYETQTVRQGVHAVMIKAVDNAGNESQNMAYCILDLGDLLEENVLIRKEFHDNNWNGVYHSGKLLSDGYIHANNVNNVWSERTKYMFGSPDNVMWKSKFLPYDVVAALPVKTSGQFWLKCDIEGPAVVYYRKILNLPFWKKGSNATFNEPNACMWPVDSNVSIWKQYSDRVIVSKGDTIQIKVHSLNNSFEETIIKGIEAVIDVPDRNEHFEDLLISKNGTELPIVTPHYKTTAVHIDAIQGSAVSVKFVSKTPCIIQMIDSNGIPVDCIVDVSWQGYEEDK